MKEIPMTFTAGLVSVTFRQLSPPQIVDLAHKAQLQTIEWGADIHVPAGDLVRAREVRGMTVDAGLSITSYGSYFRAGEDDPADFSPVLESAQALGALSIRIWAGRRGSANAVAEYRQQL